jgi:hypothetical protein
MTSAAAFLVFANDVDPAHRDDYEDWHALHHVPQRLQAPGILRAQRYRGTEGALREYLTVYWLEGLDVLASAPYRRLAQHPDARTTAMRAHLRQPWRLAASRLSENGDIATVPMLMVRNQAACDPPGGLRAPAADVRDSAWLHGRIEPAAAGHPLTEGAPRESGLITLIGAAEVIKAVGADPGRYEPVGRPHERS